MTSDSTPDFNAVGALLGNTLAQAHAQDAQQQQLATAFGFLQRSMGGRGRGNGGYGNSNQGYNGYQFKKVGCRYCALMPQNML